MSEALKNIRNFFLNFDGILSRRNDYSLNDLPSSIKVEMGTLHTPSSDIKEIRGDFHRVGNDMQNAIKTYERQSS